MQTMYKHDIYDIAVNTFEITCYMFPLEEWEIEDEENSSFEEAGVQSVVGFHGAAEGAMLITPSNDLLLAMAANMLGIEEPDDEQQAGALCEIANIICGNMAPLFAQNDEICYIEPPQILSDEESLPHVDDGMQEESTEVLLDEGKVKISVWYS